MDEILLMWYRFTTPVGLPICGYLITLMGPILLTVYEIRNFYFLRRGKLVRTGCEAFQNGSHGALRNLLSYQIGEPKAEGK
jgi:hypothetical protein